MKCINVIKIGNSVKISINGKLHQKNCGSPKEADELFRLSLTAKENPTDFNIKNIRAFLNEKTRIAIIAGLENDPETGEVFMAGFNTPLPETLINVIKEYHENGYPMQAISNFWALLMLNPDKRVRTDLFDFIKTHDFSLTDSGYMVVYKAVLKLNVKEDDADTTFSEFISNKYLHVKKKWKESPKNYVVYKDNVDEFQITKTVTAEKWNETEKDVEFLGNLAELFDAIFNNEQKDEETNIPVYTDKHSRTIRIVLGEPVRMKRNECDGDPKNDCSYGNHCGSTKYVENFANNGDTILVCLVNPAHVVAVPQYNHSKFRTSEYFPFAIATYKDGRIDIVEHKYFEDDYREYEIEELEKQIANVQAGELPFESAIGAEKEERPMSELLKIIESRLVEIT